MKKIPIIVSNLPLSPTLCNIFQMGEILLTRGLPNFGSIIRKQILSDFKLLFSTPLDQLNPIFWEDIHSILQIANDFKSMVKEGLDHFQAQEFNSVCINFLDLFREIESRCLKLLPKTPIINADIHSSQENDQRPLSWSYLVFTLLLHLIRMGTWFLWNIEWEEIMRKESLGSKLEPKDISKLTIIKGKLDNLFSLICFISDFDEYSHNAQKQERFLFLHPRSRYASGDLFSAQLVDIFDVARKFLGFLHDFKTDSLDSLQNLELLIQIRSFNIRLKTWVRKSTDLQELENIPPAPRDFGSILQNLSKNTLQELRTGLEKYKTDYLVGFTTAFVDLPKQGIKINRAAKKISKFDPVIENSVPAFCKHSVIIANQILIEWHNILTIIGPLEVELQKFIQSILSKIKTPDQKNPLNLFRTMIPLIDLIDTEAKPQEEQCINIALSPHLTDEWDRFWNQGLNAEKLNLVNLLFSDYPTINQQWIRIRKNFNQYALCFFLTYLIEVLPRDAGHKKYVKMLQEIEYTAEDHLIVELTKKAFVRNRIVF